MNLLERVNTIMTKDLITLQRYESLIKVERIFKDNAIHHIPIIENDVLVGMVSKSDYLFFKRGFQNTESNERTDQLRLKTHIVNDIMTRGLATLDSDDRINVALEIFKENLFHAIPIVDDKKLVGIVTTYDVIKHLADDKGAVNSYQI